MRIAVTTIENDLNSQVCPRFGRTNFFLIVDAQTLEYKAIPNPNINVLGGAGIQSAQLLIKEEVKAVLSGKVGMNAFRILDTAGILVYENVEGTVKTTIELFNQKKLKTTNRIGQAFSNSADNLISTHGFRHDWQNKTDTLTIEKENLEIEIEKLKNKISTLENQLKKTKEN
jgi:predicted Fe-Mo cluster-binding NifX family protein